jgi:hypothetical protein
MRININDTVKIKLTKSGLKHYENHYKKLYSISRMPVRIPPLKDGYLITELWDVMLIFGDGMFNGMPEVFFENNVIDLEEHE